MDIKRVVWEGDSLDVIRSFPDGVRRDLGRGLYAVQAGELPLDAKPFKTGMSGTWELRTRDTSGQYRAIYVALVKGEVHVLHCFQKKSTKTSRLDVEKATARYRDLLGRIKG